MTKNIVGIPCVAPPSNGCLMATIAATIIIGEMIAQLRPKRSLKLLLISLKKIAKITSPQIFKVERFFTVAMVEPKGQGGGAGSLRYGVLCYVCCWIYLSSYGHVCCNSDLVDDLGDVFDGLHGLSVDFW